MRCSHANGIGGEACRAGLQRAARVSLLIAILGMVYSVLLANPALADNIPDSPYKGPTVYFTDKMDPIEVAFWARFTERADRPPDVVATLPRGYIFVAPGYSQDEYDELPGRVEVDSLFVMFSYPDGLPHKLSRSRFPNRVEIDRWRVREHRLRRYTAVLLPTAKNAYESDAFLPEEYRSWKFDQPYERYIGDYQDYRLYQGGSSVIYYYGNIDSDIRKIRCLDEKENTLPDQFCKYTTILNSQMYVDVRFVDFRWHGGVAFAEERIRVFKQIICRHVPCDDPEERYNWSYLRWPQ